MRVWGMDSITQCTRSKTITEEEIRLNDYEDLVKP